MYLKRLEVTGFKSFATKSALDFSNEKTITAIVGPNGSGKSNIADAVRWVLGETSYKTVRAKKSEDVIFSGSNGKSKASGARVSMLLDNTKGKSPIEFTEVEIERSIYRDGVSEYLINGKKARLLDVAELLTRSGFGQSTYSVIGQGMVDSMLFYGPAERKVLFDEAAGVRSYEIKREQTTRKLADTAQNIIRIKDILSELNPRLSTLKRQSERAKQKDSIAAQLLEKQKIYFASVWEKLSHQESGRRGELSRITTEEQKVKEELSELNRNFEKILNQEKRDNTKLDELRGKISQLEEKKDKLKQEIYNNRAQLSVRYSDSLSETELNNKITELEKQIAQIDLENTKNKKQELLEKLKKENPDSLRTEIQKLLSQKEGVNQELYNLRAKINIADSSGVLSAEEITRKLTGLNSELNELKISQKEKEREDLSREIVVFENKLSQLNQRAEKNKQELIRINEELQSFDYGVIGEELSDILEVQNIFLINIESAGKIADLEKYLDEGRQVSGQLEKLIDKVSGAKKGVLSGMTELQEEIEKISIEKEALLTKINNLRGKYSEIGYLIDSLTRRRNEIKGQIEELKQTKPIDKDEKKTLEKEAEKLSEEVEVFMAKIDILQGKINEAESLEREATNLEFVLAREAQRASELRQSLEQLRKVKPIDEKERNSFEATIEARESEVEKINLNITEIKTELDANSSDFTTASKALTELKDGITKKQTLLNEFNSEATNLRIELAKIETKKQDVKEEIVRDLGSEAILAGTKGIPEMDEESTRQEIEKLKSKIYSIGEIDPEVEKEFDEVRERTEYLTSQTDDLEAAKADLEKMVSELDIKIKKQFEVSFASISEKFAHFFDLLFGGGEAKLELVHQKDEDGAEDKVGIEITAVPPGKKVRSLSALSGGERTLTSLALLFAILSVNPAPFILLDEVDAALDESNTKRFLKIVQELSKETQFIFITHNRETMKDCDLIYGVTMDETHASKLLSVRLEEADKIVEKNRKH